MAGTRPLWTIGLLTAVAGLTANAQETPPADAPSATAPAAVESAPPQPPPLHERIDAAMAGATTLEAAPLAGDADFLRRAALDILGVPPTADEVRQFLDDASPTKRRDAIERYFADPRFERHLAEVLDVMLMERRGNANVPQDEWMAYLLQSVRENKPWNALAREILAADGQNGPRAAARFYLDRGSEPNLITRDVGRIFFGRDLQCAQCHDHPLVDDYRMTDYQGLLAVFSAGYEVKVKQGDKELACYAERAGSDLEFESVFIKGTKHLTAARLPGGMEWSEPAFVPGEEYQVAPADNTVSVPKFSRRQRLAETATSGENRAFNENIANRLWGMVMGRGLVYPADMLQAGNPATNPELLRLLADELAGAGFAIRPFLKELMLTRTYQRAWDPTADVLAASERAGTALPGTDAELPPLQAAASEATAALDAALASHQAAEANLIPAVAELDAVRKKYGDELKKTSEAQQAVATAQSQLTEKQGVAAPVAEAAAKAQEAAAKLPNDAELAAAAAKFVERSGQLQGEVAALQQALAEKQAAHKAADDARLAVRPEVEAALQKTAPLREALHAVDQEVVAARSRAAAAGIALHHLQQRLESLQRLASLKPLDEQIAAQVRVIDERNTQLAAAQTQVTEYGATMSAAQQKLTEMTGLQTAATDALTKIQAEHLQQAAGVESVATALKSTEAAREKLPDDAVLVETAGKLKQRVEELTAALSTHQQQVDAAAQTLAAAQQQVTSATQELDAAGAEMARRQQAQAAAATELSTAQATAEQQQSLRRETAAGVTDAWSRQFTLSDLRPLTPEQMCWSIFQTTGVYERYRAAEIAELDQASPLSEEAKQDPGQVLARERELEQRVYDKLKGNVGTFIGLFGAGPGQPQGDFFATADQALYAANAGAIVSWVAPAAANPTDRAVQAAEPQQAAEHLYLGYLSRLPTPAETADVEAYLAARPDQKAAAVQELAWGLVTSSEFRFNH